MFVSSVTSDRRWKTPTMTPVVVICAARVTMRASLSQPTMRSCPVGGGEARDEAFEGAGQRLDVEDEAQRRGEAELEAHVPQRVRIQQQHKEHGGRQRRRCVGATFLAASDDDHGGHHRRTQRPPPTRPPAACRATVLPAGRAVLPRPLSTRSAIFTKTPAMMERLKPEMATMWLVPVATKAVVEVVGDAGFDAQQDTGEQRRLRLRQQREQHVQRVGFEAVEPIPEEEALVRFQHGDVGFAKQRVDALTRQVVAVGEVLEDGRRFEAAGGADAVAVVDVGIGGRFDQHAAFRRD